VKHEKAPALEKGPTEPSSLNQTNTVAVSPHKGETLIDLAESMVSRISGDSPRSASPVSDFSPQKNKLGKNDMSFFLCDRE
jgi:hypothetical protein